MTVDEIVATFYTILIAGSETTSTLLSAATFYLLKNQDMMSKLVKEIRSSFQTEDEITQISVNKLTYLIAVLNETMRIHPPTPQGGPRIIPSDGQMVDGHWVPGGVSSLPLFSC
jgi:cytochrome P450